jgi:RHS repeat-associated protein
MTRRTPADLLRALQLLETGDPSADEILHGDVAPPGQGDGQIGAADVLLLHRALRGDDVDGDGLESAEELELGASPFLADTDGDGLSDLAEAMQGGTNPANPDSDGDGLPDAEDAAPLAGTVYLHGDHLGSAVILTRGDDPEVERVVYGPFGAAVPPAAGQAASVPERGFTGQRHEPGLALYDYGARWYEPALGRFLQPDPLVGNPFDPQSLNRYSYVGNDPANRVDPTGMQAQDAVPSAIDYRLAQTVGSGAPTPPPLVASGILPSLGGSGSVFFRNGSRSGTPGGVVGQGTFELFQGTGNTTFGREDEEGGAQGSNPRVSAGFRFNVSAALPRLGVDATGFIGFEVDPRTALDPADPFSLRSIGSFVRSLRDLGAVGTLIYDFSALGGPKNGDLLGPLDIDIDPAGVFGGFFQLEDLPNLAITDVNAGIAGRGVSFGLITRSADNGQLVPIGGFLGGSAPLVPGAGVSAGGRSFLFTVEQLLR